MILYTLRLQGEEAVTSWMNSNIECLLGFTEEPPRGTAKLDNC